MRLSRLSGRTDAPSGDVEVTGLTADSRAVGPGFLFAALPGSRADGRAYIMDAVAKGAVAILAPRGTALPDGTAGVTLIEDDEPRHAFARMAAAFHGRQPETVVAVTGTNGKTSTVQFVRQIWAALGHKAASLGTLGLIGPGVDRYGSMTTPDPVALHRDLAALADAGIDHLAMEASSHGLDQFRLDGVRLAAAGFTNLTRDHLDYHGSMEAYLAAKAALFGRVLPAGATAVLNADSDAFATLAAICSSRATTVLGYGLTGRELAVRAVEPLAHGQRLHLTVLGRDLIVELPLVGRFQAWNALCALGLVIASGGDRDRALDALAGLEGVPGRLQHVATRANRAAIYVDYAHTPDALETVLRALRPHAARQLVCVFGCGGDRDRGKRPVMGELAGRLADRAIVTDDNPRTEDPAFVRGEVLAGSARLEEIGDRRQAIRTAVAGLQAGDVLVIAGKGHEQGQTVGTEVRPFDDATEARAAVAEVGE
ncbi:UDP-N-acetylmuramoyl-L-alanyl-D-glutamate--2,6-diaminopimelate ligase [Azospirillum sp. RWY-5-1]|uniref:UDP-N-acetylmuramoyl-L-alanyl-D-glutamate--2,6-diaminopimelate ligase n=1 Tax=Azospirillum oleiclasticum TaxID=2735135 RepID=A0ABX2TDW7_9PROT|nr:UDP-N-acetylmuramoyl-L-alanyl-D-glutamate--2,6-diaminopimelate ligase [Azospirillum oleiclasticum]NYZ15715.1 UDP-N-acetylmuramoyl-L-alanyl-D-glutamate--2,6-diaminopimelate ligase [Azospirillum oleiclasticum]NYZ21985.1 UDP-N-acetylmuramoyl-L-alanyl-D-glutamate--2,6-diaminopimelate ligase [Azospirillum oleiclasticum]